MILVLQDPKTLVTDVASQNAVLKLEQLKRDQIYISLEDAYEMRRQALKAGEDGKKEIEKTKDEVIQQIEKKGKEIHDNLDTHFDQRLQEQNKSKEISDVETLNSGLTEDEKGLQRYLLEFYRNEYIQIPISPLSTKYRKSVEELYVPLQAKIFCKHKNVAATKLVDVFQQDNKVMRSIYLTGEAGIGKSTFCRKLISLWCTVRENEGKLPHDYTPVFDFINKSSTGNSSIQSVEGFEDYMDGFYYESYMSDESDTSHTECSGDDSSLCNEDLNTGATENAFTSYKSNKDSLNSAAKKSQITGDDTDNALIKKYDFLFFISLRDTHLEVSIEDMIVKQLLFQNSELDKCFKSTIVRIPEKCLCILDGLDEWQPPKPLPTHPTVTRGLPLSSVGGKYVKLFTTRRWKYESLSPCIEEHESEVRLTGIGKKSSKALIENMLVSQDRTIAFETAVSLSDTNDLGSIPLLLKLLICLWQENSKLETSKTELYCSIINIMLHLAEKRNDLPFVISTQQLPHMLEVFPYIKDNSNIVFKLSQFAFDSLFKKRNESTLVFSMFDLSQQGLSSREILLFLQTGILTQKSLSSESTFIPKTSLSFIHKSFQEYFAAVHIATADSDKNEIRKIIACRCGQTYQIVEMANVFYFLADLHQDLYQEILKEIASHCPDRGIALGHELDLTLKLKGEDICLTDIFLRGNPKSVVIESTNYGIKGLSLSRQNQKLQILELRSVSLTHIAFKTLLESISISGKGVDVTLICIGWIDGHFEKEMFPLSVHVRNVGKLKIKFTNLTKVEFILPQNICTVEFTENDMTDNGLSTMINSVSKTKGDIEMTFHRIKLRKSKYTHCNSDCPLLNITVNACEVNKRITIGEIKICKSYITHTGTCSDLQNVQLRELTIKRVDLTIVSFSSVEIDNFHLINAISKGLGKFKVSSQNRQLQVLELECVCVKMKAFGSFLKNIPMSDYGVDVTLVNIIWIEEDLNREFLIDVKNIRKLKIQSTSLAKIKWKLSKNIRTVELIDTTITSRSLSTIIESFRDTEFNVELLSLNNTWYSMSKISKIVLNRSQIIDVTLGATIKSIESVSQESNCKIQSCPLNELWIENTDIEGVFLSSKEFDIINFVDLTIQIKELKKILGKKIIGHLCTVLENFKEDDIVTFTGSNTDELLISDRFNLRYQKSNTPLEISVNDNKVVSVLTISNRYLKPEPLFGISEVFSVVGSRNDLREVIKFIPPIEQMKLNLHFENITYLSTNNFAYLVEQLRNSACKIFSVTMDNDEGDIHVKDRVAYVYDTLKPEYEQSKGRPVLDLIKSFFEDFMRISNQHL
ncbi:uncharacterized protein LOC132731861 [Ruditapes philippinarum]|uniref:uncharacterized protein LOC132731861 n=1 Tax=Ruditapes philippinarum TaxID=129788 RepID=UPI00295C25D8|nr:uncharacterized protein LOC132731861 [Ruditapes philippinarum]